ncbi:MAG: DUF4124 domain-containing protein [Pseudomonadota bacterium]|nr:DUF4124 domain-containing protein [Pseudomonadota bacterium]
MIGLVLKQLPIRPWLNLAIKLVLLSALLLAADAHAEVLRCVDTSGKTIYTDNRALCYSGETTSLDLAVGSKSGSTKKGKVDYRIPARQYESVGSHYTVFIERDLVEGNAKLASQARQKLEATLTEIFFVLPQVPAKKLRQMTFYLMWGEGSPNGGRKSGMSYIRSGEPKNYAYLDPRWENVIVIYSAKNFMYLDSLWSKKALMHELAHAWHLTNWPENHKPIVSAYRNAKGLGLYRNVKDNKGNIIKEAYAIKNNLEYFAELSAIYFVGGNYYPANNMSLRKYDLVGFQMIDKHWIKL